MKKRLSRRARPSVDRGVVELSDPESVSGLRAAHQRPIVDRDVGEPSDAELVSRLRAADPAAFDEAYARYRAPLFSFLVRLARTCWLAEDLLQETWLRLARHATDLPSDTSLRPWLFTVARNLFVSQRRWAVLDGDRLRELGLWPKARSDSPFEATAANETERRLESALGRIPIKYREALLLVAVEGLEPAEAAQVLGLRPDALRQRLARARSMLREELLTPTHKRKPR